MKTLRIAKQRAAGNFASRLRNSEIQSPNFRNDMPVPLQTILDFLAAFAPLELAEDWDNVGLLLGDESAPVSSVMTCLTLTPDVADEAIEQNAQLIVSHHPVLFRPIQKLTTSSAEGRMLLPLCRKGIAVYSPHTAFDSAQEGINQFLAECFELEKIEVLRPHPEESGANVGAGRAGRLTRSMRLGEFLDFIKLQLKTGNNTARSVSSVRTHLQFTGDLDRMISKVGVGCGSAAEYLKDAQRVGCDVYVTGEARFHSCLEARERNLALVLLGHYASERPAVEGLAKVLSQRFSDLKIWASCRENDPVQWSLDQ